MKVRLVLSILIILCALVGIASAANSFTYSEQFNNAAWTKGYVSITGTDVIAAPDSTISAEAMNTTTDTAQVHKLYQNKAVTDNLNYTMSWYVKADTDFIVQIYGSSAIYSASNYANFNISSGVCAVTASASGTAAATDAGGGWCRVSWTTKATASGTNLAALAFAENNPTQARADGYTAAASHRIYVWGAQFEQSDAVTAYTATNNVITASFNTNATAGAAPLAVGFTDTSTGETPTAWNWSFRNVTGNNTEVWFSTLQNPSLVLGIGNYSIKLNASTASLTNISTQVTFVNVSDTGVAPTANFSASRTTGGRNVTIAFTDTSLNSPASWYWTFGDGDTSTDQNPSHKYTDAGTYHVNLTATSADGSDSENKTSYITISAYEDEYMNPYSVMVPWLDQGDNPWCAGFSASNAMMILRYQELGITPNETEEPVTRNTWFNWSTYTVQGDTHVSYVPSMSDIYWRFRALDGDTADKDILGELLTAGIALEGDKFTPKYVSANYYYPQNSSYLSTHRYNPIGDYITQGQAAGTWELLKQNISSNGVVIARIDVYSNSHDEPSGTNYPLYADPVGVPSGGHWVAMIGFNSSLEEIYFLQSWGENRFEQDWTKLMGFSKEFWEYENADRSEFLVPMNMTVNDGTPAGDPNPDPEPPVAAFSANATTGTSPLAVLFTDESTNTPTSWSWAFTNITPGNNTQVWFSQEQNPVHTFTPGNWSIKLNASNSAGYNITPGTYWINVSWAPAITPEASFTADVITGPAPLAVIFTDLSTNSPTAWGWYMDDDENATSILQNPAVTFNTPGNYSIRLYASNAAGGNWSNQTNMISVTNATAFPSIPGSPLGSMDWVVSVLGMLSLLPLIGGIGLIITAISSARGREYVDAGRQVAVGIVCIIISFLAIALLVMVLGAVTV